MTAIGAQIIPVADLDWRGGDATPPPKAVRAAHEFEAQMMAELFKPLTSPDEPMESEEDNSSDAGGPLGQFAGEALAEAVSQHGGLGIANLILKNFSRSGNQ